jgi:hypothetical protein
MPDESRARQTATALLVLEAVLLACALPVQLLMLLASGWEGGDEALEHRLAELVPMLALLCVAAAVLATVAASTAWRHPEQGASVTGVTAALVVALAAGWLLVLRSVVLDPVYAAVWLVMTLPAIVAFALLVVRRPVRPGEWSPPRSRG